MKIFGLDVHVSDSVPANDIFVVPSWFTEVRIVEGVPLRLRGTAEKAGKTYQQFSPLTKDELKQFIVLKNVGTPAE